jgi:hypothetical protein
MRVTFAKIGERSYSVAARRASGDVLHMPRGPGYDPWLPHDVVHFVVERHFGIACGVFGQLAAGGDAGTFFTIPHRRRDPARRLSNRLGALGREDTARSERLAGACMAAWHARHDGRWEFADAVDGAELASLPEALLAELDEVADRWHVLGPSSKRGCSPRRTTGRHVPVASDQPPCRAIGRTTTCRPSNLVTRAGRRRLWATR